MTIGPDSALDLGIDAWEKFVVTMAAIGHMHPILHMAKDPDAAIAREANLRPELTKARTMPQTHPR